MHSPGKTKRVSSTLKAPADEFITWETEVHFLAISTSTSSEILSLDQSLDPLCGAEFLKTCLTDHWASWKHLQGVHEFNMILTNHYVIILCFCRVYIFSAVLNSNGQFAGDTSDLTRSSQLIAFKTTTVLSEKEQAIFF